MKGLLVGLLVVGTLAACGETSNYLGDEPSGGAGAGQNVGGKTTAGSPSKAGSGGSASQSGAGSGDSGGMGGSSVAGSAGMGGGSAGGGPSKCEEATALDGNWSKCGDGAVHRTTPGKCAYTPSAEELEPLGEADECTKDSDCAAQPFGLCQPSYGAFFQGNVCSYGCEQDSDCSAGNICVCAATSISSFGSWGTQPVGECHPSGNCASDADCAAGLLCTPFDSNPGCYSPIFTCQTPEDECTVPQDCAGFPHESCSSDGTHRVCANANCVVD